MARVRTPTLIDQQPNLRRQIQPPGIGASLVVVVILAVAVVGMFARTAAAAGSATPPGRIERVLVVSIPGIAWRDLAGRQLPNLDRLLQDSAVADMTIRTIGTRDLASSYLTIGAGTRATSTGLPDDGEGLSMDERFGSVSAPEAFHLRTGASTSSGIAQLGVATLTQANVTQDVDVTIGSLGTALEQGGWSRAVIGNGDGLLVDNDVTSYRRFAVNALMTKDGTVPGGRVDAGLLERDDTAPFGVRANIDATVAAFRDAWQPKSVVLVEASDLARATDFVPLASASHRTRVLDEALRRADALVGRLLTEVDPARDAVLVVAPGLNAGGDSLTIAALRAPGVRPGLLRSASTRRTGFVLLADVGPTVVDLAGLPTVKAMSGSPFVAQPTARGYVQRQHFLVDQSKAGRFRDAARGPVTLVYTRIQAGLVAGAFLVLVWRRRGRARRALRFAALASLGFVPAVYLMRLLPFQNWGMLSFNIVLAVTALGLGGLYQLLGRRVKLGPIILALATISGLQIFDVVFLGTRLQLASAFGYSATVGVRVAGLGNISYAFLSSAAILLSGLVAHQIGGRRGAYVAIAILTTAVVVDVAPFWGSDFGGIPSMVPAFFLVGAILLGIRLRIRLRTVLTGGLVTFAVVVVAAAVDLSRPARDQTHIGRLITSISENGPEKLFNVIGRKLSQNLATLSNSDWRNIVPMVAVLIAYLAFSERRWLAHVVARIPEMRATLIGFAVLATLGYSLNDSGIAIPAAMLGVLNGTLIWLVTEDDQSRSGSSPAIEDAARQGMVSTPA